MNTQSSASSACRLLLRLVVLAGSLAGRQAGWLVGWLAGWQAYPAKSMNSGGRCNDSLGRSLVPSLESSLWLCSPARSFVRSFARPVGRLVAHSLARFLARSLTSANGPRPPLTARL